MAKLSTDELLEAFKDLTLIELSEFVKKFEETFDVTAAAPVAVAAAPAAGCRRRGPRGEGRVQRRPRGRRRQEDPGHQGRPRAGLGPGPQGGQGPGRVRPEADPRGRGQGRGRRREDQAGGRRGQGQPELIIPRSEGRHPVPGAAPRSRSRAQHGEHQSQDHRVEREGQHGLHGHGAPQQPVGDVRRRWCRTWWPPTPRSRGSRGTAAGRRRGTATRSAARPAGCSARRSRPRAPSSRAPPPTPTEPAAAPAPSRRAPARSIRGSTAAATSATAANTTASSGPSLPPRRIAAHSDERFGRPDARPDQRVQHLGRGPGERAHRGQHVDQAPHVEEQQPAQRRAWPPGPTASAR